MLKKTFAVLSAFVISISSVYCCLADTTENLTEFYTNLEKAEFKKSSFTYTDDTLYGGMIDFKNGVIGGKIDDFDNDTKKELLVFRLEKGGQILESPDLYNREKAPDSVIAEIYEETNDGIKKADSFTASDLFYTDAGEYEFFIKEKDDKKYICIQNISYSTCFADGIIFDTEICTYNGTNFENEVSLRGMGSSFDFGSYYTEEISALREMDFDTSINQMLDGYNIINFAKFEKNIEKIVEFSVNTNATDLGEIYGYTNLEQTLKNYGEVTVSLNNFTTIEQLSSIKTLSIILDNKELSFNQPPYIENGVTMVPMRAIFEALGASVSFDPETKEIIAEKDGNIISLIIGSDIARVNSKETNIGIKVRSLEGSAMVPLRLISETFGAKVDYNGITKVITITSK